MRFPFPSGIARVDYLSPAFLFMSTPRITLMAALCAAALPAYAETAVSSAPHGVMSATLPVGATGLSFPLLASVFEGRVASNTPAMITFENTGLAASLTAGVEYYLEIIDGPFEGERFDLNTAATRGSGKAKVETGQLSHTTFKSLKKDQLAGARAVVRPHLTLAALGEMFSPRLSGHLLLTFSDTVQIHGEGLGIETFFYRPDGSWRLAHIGPKMDDKIIPPDVSMVLLLRSGVKQWTHLGEVRTNAFRKNLRPGLQSFATGFPLDLSAVQIGAFVDPQTPAAWRWTGSNQSWKADKLSVFDNAARTYRVHFLRGDGSAWFQEGGSTDVANTPFLPAQGAILLDRAKADPGYLIIRPYSL